jgi:hypothetical protein
VADAVPTGNLGSCVAYLEFVGKRMPGMADAIIDRLGDPERVTRLADAALGNMQNTFTFLQFAFAQMPSIARRMAAMLAEPKRAVALGVNPETEGIKLYAIFRILELMDLYDPELAKQIVLLSPEAAKTTWAAYYYGDDDGPHISVGQGG